MAGLSTRMRGSIALTLLCLINHSLYAEPWFTGPLLVNWINNVEKGHANLFFLSNYSSGNSIYNNAWHTIATQPYSSAQVSPTLTYGLTDYIAVQLNSLYILNHIQRLGLQQGATAQHIGDTLMLLGVQILRQKNHDSVPDVSLSLNQLFPTGKYDELSATSNGTDVTGAGSYQTGLSANVRYLYQFDEQHFLNSYLSLTYTHANDVSVNGLTAYGVETTKREHLRPGDYVVMNLASEFSLTQNWVIVMEAVWLSQQATSFHGSVGTTGAHPFISHDINNLNLINGSRIQLSVAPEIEYNFSANFGLIAGVWFTPAGRNAPNIITPALAFNAYW